MPAAKLVVMYPVPKDLVEFERVYRDQRVPIAVNNLAGKAKIVATKVLGSAQDGAALFHRIAEIHFPSISCRSVPPRKERKRRWRTPCRFRQAARRSSSSQKRRRSCSKGATLS